MCVLGLFDWGLKIACINSSDLEVGLLFTRNPIVFVA